MYECFHCLEKAVVWDSDYDYEDFGYDGEGIVQCLHCCNCGADIEYRISTEEVKDMKEDIKNITDIEELKRLFLELNEEKEKDEKKIKNLERKLEDIEDLIKSYPPETIGLSEKALLDSILLIKKGTIQFYRGEDKADGE